MHGSETENKPFVLIARIHVKPGNVDQYLEIAAKVDAEVENSEPGMLFHSLDADPPALKCTSLVALTKVYRECTNVISLQKTLQSLGYEDSYLL